MASTPKIKDKQELTDRDIIEKALHISPVITDKMYNKIKEWESLYRGEASWLHDPERGNPTRIVSIGLPNFIASERARMATLEMKSEITTPQNKPRDNEKPAKQMVKGSVTEQKVEKVNVSPRVKFLNDVYQNKVLRRLKPNLEYGCATGGMIIKPYVVKVESKIKNKDGKVKLDVNGKEVTQTSYKMEIDFVNVRNFTPLAFTVNGEITAGAFIQTKVDKDTIYRRIEYHRLEGSTVIIRNTAYMSKNTNPNIIASLIFPADIGNQIPLSSVPEWKDLVEEVVIDNVDRLLFGFFKNPEANTIEPNSPLGMSVYGRAIDLIKDADEMYSNLLWEYEATQAAIDIDRDALKPYEDRNGDVHAVNVVLQERLFRRLDLGQDDTYNPYLPKIRDESILNGLNAILTRIEDVCSLSRGTISIDYAVEARNAGELKILKQRAFSVNAAVQKELEYTLKTVIYVMNVYCDLYKINEAAEYDVSFEWDDSIIVDNEAEANKRLALIQNGIMSKLEFRMWYFGETEEQARLALEHIEDENKKSILQNAKLQQEAGMMLQTFNNNNRNQQKQNGRDDDGQRAAAQQQKINNGMQPKE